MSIRDFRNYKSLDIDFNSRLTFFIGENGEGKTNFLESIQMLSTLKSFRDNSDDEILSWNSDTFYLSGCITKDIHDIKLELGYTKKESKRKKIKVNGNEISKKINPKSYFIENAKQLKKSGLSGIKKVAISAGASTPEWVIDEVVNKIRKYS